MLLKHWEAAIAVWWKRWWELKWSTLQFIGKGIDDLRVDKDGGPIVSITGATITSRAITNSIREKLSSLLPELKISEAASQEVN
ncbi:MAG: FMN-binding protein [Calditrichota bacterium]